MDQVGVKAPGRPTTRVFLPARRSAMSTCGQSRPRKPSSSLIAGNASPTWMERSCSDRRPQRAGSGRPSGTRASAQRGVVACCCNALWRFRGYGEACRRAGTRLRAPRTTPSRSRAHISASEMAVERHPRRAPLAASRGAPPPRQVVRVRGTLRSRQRASRRNGLLRATTGPHPASPPQRLSSA